MTRCILVSFTITLVYDMHLYYVFETIYKGVTIKEMKQMKESVIRCFLDELNLKKY